MDTSYIDYVPLKDHEHLHCMETGLYLGGLTPVVDPEDTRLTDVGIDVVIRAMSDHDVKYFKVMDHLNWRAWHHIPVDDTEDTNIYQYFRQVHDWITQSQATGKKVYVHCRMGISRSATLVIAHFMLKYGWTRRQAIEHVSRRRPIICPNDGFMKQLARLEQEILSQGHVGSTTQ